MRQHSTLTISFDFNLALGAPDLESTTLRVLDTRRACQDARRRRERRGAPRACEPEERVQARGPPPAAGPRRPGARRVRRREPHGRGRARRAILPAALVYVELRAKALAYVVQHWAQVKGTDGWKAQKERGGTEGNPAAASVLVEVFEAIAEK